MYKTDTADFSDLDTSQISYGSMSGGGASTSMAGGPRLTGSTAGGSATVTLTFNETVQAGSGNIILTDGSAQTIIGRDGQPTMRIVGATDTRTISIYDSTQVAIVDGEVRLTVAGLKTGATYSVLMAKGVLQDLDAHPFGGIASSLTTRFTAVVPNAAPTATLALDKTVAGSNAPMTLTVTFSEAVQGVDASDFNAPYGSIGSFTSNVAKTIWTASYTPDANVQVGSTNRISLNGANFQDLDGLAGSGTYYSPYYAVDTIAPHVTSNAAQTNVSTSAPITITFDEAVYWTEGTISLTADSVTRTIARSDATISADGKTLTIAASVHQMAAEKAYTLTLPSAMTDWAGNRPDLSVISLDTHVSAPTTQRAYVTTVDGYYNAGDIILIDVEFDRPVQVQGTPTLVLETGTTDRSASYYSGADSTILTFKYTVQAGDTSTALAIKDLSGLVGTIKDSSGTVLDNAHMTLSAGQLLRVNGANAHIAIDTDAPAAPTIDLDAASDYGASNTDNQTYAGGLTLKGTAEAYATVTVIDLGNINTVIGTATANTSGEWSLTTNYTAGNYSLVARQTDLAGNQSIGSSTLSMSVTAAGLSKPSAPDLDMNSDTGNHYDSITTDTTPEFWFYGTPAYGDILLYDNGVYVETFRANSSGFTLAAVTQPLSLGTHSFTIITKDDSNNYSVRSDATDVTVTDAVLEVNQYLLYYGQTATFTAYFAKPVTTLDASQFTVANGTLGAFTSYDGGLRWSATLTPTAEVNDSSNTVQLAGTALTFADGSHGQLSSYASSNYALQTGLVRSFYWSPSTVTAGGELTAYINFGKPASSILDSAFSAPNASLVSKTNSDGTWIVKFSPTLAGALDDSNVLSLDLTKVTFTDTTQGNFTYSSPNYIVDTRVDAYVNNDISISSDSGISGSDRITNVRTQTISGTYSGVLDAGETVYLYVPGLSIDPASVSIDTAAHRWSYTVTLPVNSNLTVTALVQDSTHGLYSSYRTQTFSIDQTGPAPSYGTILTGLDPRDDVVIQFDENVYWSDTSTMQLTAGASTVTLQRSDVTLSGSTLTIPAAKHAMLTGQTYTLTLPSGLTDAAGNGGANITLSTISTTDHNAPVATSLSTSATDATYKLGDVLHFSMHFDEQVVVDTDAYFTFNTGEYLGRAVYESGSGTDTISFKYEVDYGEVSGDLGIQSFSGLFYNVRDYAGNQVTSTTSVPLTDFVNASNANTHIVVDGAQPEITSAGSAAGKFQIAFTETIKFGTGSIYVFNSQDVLQQTYSLSSSQVSLHADGSGNNTILWIDAPFAAGDYTVEWDQHAILDLAGNDAYDGYADIIGYLGLPA